MIRLLRWFAPLVGGVLTALSVPPFGWWPLGIVGLGLLSWSFIPAGAAGSVGQVDSLGRVGDAAKSRNLNNAGAGPGRRARLRAGMFFGLGLYGITLSWMAQFTLAGSIFVAVLESTITALVLLFLPRRRAAALVPAGIVMADCLRSLWPFGGLPLGGIDLGQAAGPLAPTVTIGGRLLLIGLTALIGTVFAHAVEYWRVKRPHVSVALPVCALMSALLVLLCTWLPSGTRADGGVVRLGIVQGGGPRGELASTNNARRTFDAHLAATNLLRESDRLDAVLWPENTVDVSKLETSAELPLLVAQAARLQAPLLIGLVEDLDDRFALNEQAVVTPNGQVAERFEKVRRVPFGEYFPFRNIIKKYAAIPKRDFRPGTRPGTLDAAGTRFAVAISYEGFFDDRTRGGVRAGGKLVIIPTNASSYVTSQVPTQQIAAAKLRARETGRWTVQAGPTGLSAVITPNGDMVWRSVIERREVHVHAVPLRSGQTLYSRTNDAPTVFLALAGLAFAWSESLRQRTRRSSARR